MKYCSHCGNEIMDEAVVCTKCGCATGYEDKTVAKQKSEKSNTLQTIAKVFMIIGTVAMGWMIIPLAWCLPLTISYCNKIKNGEEITTGFKVACLLCVNTIAGILMLCDKD